MPTPATVNVGTGVTGSAGGTAATTQNGRQQSQAVTPFVRASQLHREGAFYDQSKVLNAVGAQDLGTIPIPAYGYVRAIVVLVQATGGVGTAVFAEDGPWSALTNIYLSEPNGATIVQFSTGYHLYLANKYGGYWGSPYDPKQNSLYSTNTAGGNFSFMLRIPVEINLRDALGSLPNQNAAASFNLRMTLANGATNAASTALYTTQPATSFPTVRIRCYLEAWDQPEVSTAGIPNQTTPPAMNTTQFWSEQIFPVNAGQQTIRLTRMGNYIRNFIYVYRRTAGTRANGDGDWPDPTVLYWDTRPLDTVEKNQWKNQIYERYNYVANNGTGAVAAEAAGGLDNGVFPYDFCHEFDGHVGVENRDLWLPTLSSTRWEIQGNFANAGTLTVLTNDVSVAGNVFM